MAEHEEGCACCRLGVEGARKLRDEMMRNHGHIVIGVGDASPPFCYSVGLWGFNLPELIVSGLSNRQGAQLINMVALWMEGEGVPEDGQTDDTPMSLPTRFQRVRETTIYDMMTQTKASQRMVSQHPYAMQIVWPDREGRFPDEPGFDTFFVQSLL